jgi:hypothetical protein
MRRPSHRHNDPMWCPGPRSAWAQYQSGWMYARHLPTAVWPEFLYLARRISRAQLLVMYQPYGVKP